MLHLGDAQRVRAGADRHFQILRQFRGINAVHSDQHIFFRRAVIPHSLIHQKSGGILGIRRDGILQIIYYAVLVVKPRFQHFSGAGTAHIQ